MAQKALTDKQLRDTIAAVRRHGSVASAARAVGVARGTMEARWSRARVWAQKQGIELPSTAQAASGRHTDGFNASGDSAEVSKVTPARIKTLADLIRVCEIDTTEWSVDRWTCNKWEMGSVPPVTGNDADGWERNDDQPRVTELFQIKAWLKRKTHLIDARAEIAALIEDSKKGLPKVVQRLAPKAAKSGFMLEINVVDLHKGKLAWSGETGHDSYDTRIAEALHDSAVDTLLTRTDGYKFDEIVLVLGNDLMHVDSRANMTTAGTPQDTDSRYHKVFRSLTRMARRTIERCRPKCARVRVVMVPGNHDRDSVWHLGEALAFVYEGYKDVIIENAPTARKYVEFGRVMLLFTHGDKGKRADYPLLMATEQPQMFGRTRFREAHTGHFHQTQVQEWHGVRVRILPSLSGTDAWHAENTYVGNLRAAEAFIWSAEEGLVGTVYYTVPTSGDQAA